MRAMMRTLRTVWLALVASCALLVARPAAAGETLNVQDWLAQPGVRLVAVEFYATWCKPCMEAMPRWKRLKEKYASQGLRVIVVNTQDPDGACRALPFVPDETVCDLEGHIADGFKLQGKLPSAFLWSWQGNLLVSKGHIDEIERAVEAYLQDAPRVIVEPSKDVPADAVVALRDRLTDDGKIQVLAGAAEQEAIEAAKRAQQGARYDERLACEIGKEVPPNALLKATRVAQGKSAFLNLSLYDLKGGCLLAAASSEWAEDGRRVAQDAASKLLRKLKRPDGMQQPAGGAVVAGVTQPARSPRADRVVNPEDRNWKPKSDDPSLVIFESTPPGARVEVDGNVLCEKTPCRKMLDPGQPVVRMSMASFVAREERVKVDGEQRLQWSLEKNTAMVTIDAGLAGAPITVDGEAAGTSPLRLELTAGSHRIEISDPCYEPARADVGITRGAEKTVTLKGVQKTAGLKVELSDPDGDPAEGDVQLDGRVVGRTWKTLQVPACGKVIEVQSGGQTWRERVELVAYETKKVQGELAGARKKAIAAPVPAPWKRGAGKWSLGIGLASLATGVTFAALASSAGSDIQSRHDACVSSGNAADCPPQADVDAAFTQSAIGNVGIVGGAALTLLGTYWLLTAPSEEAPRAVRVHVGPLAIGLEGSF